MRWWSGFSLPYSIINTGNYYELQKELIINNTVIELLQILLAHERNINSIIGNPKMYLQLAKSTSTPLQNLVLHHDIFTNAMPLQMPHFGTKAGCFIGPQYSIQIKLLHEHQNHSNLYHSRNTSCFANQTEKLQLYQE